MSGKENTSDIQLMNQIRKENASSLQSLFDRYYEPLCNFAFLFLKDFGKTEELVSDVFIRLWQKRDQTGHINNVKAYLYKSVRNAVISHFRKNRLEITDLKNYENLSKLDITPETLLIREELKMTVGNMIDSMPRQAGLVFRMHKIDGLSYKEIATTLNLSIKTIENHMGRALRFVKEIYSAHPDRF